MSDLIKQVDSITSITTRGDKLPTFRIFDEKKLARIAAGMPEIHRASRVFGRSNTQSTNRLMTLTMLADASPYRVIRQCLAQIENKKNALKETRFKHLKDQVRLKRYRARLEKETDPIEQEMLEIKIEQKITVLADSVIYIEGALKDLASFQSSYQQVCKNKRLPEQWDEEDMEKAEVEHHVRMAYLHAFRDIMCKRTLGMGTLEYLQQFGVHPAKAHEETFAYVKALTGNEDYEHLECWLDDRVEENKENYKMVLKRIGIDMLYETWYQYKED